MGDILLGATLVLSVHDSRLLVPCTQATSARHYGEKDARLEYLSWRVWFMKRNRARAKQDQAKAHAAGVVEDATGSAHGAIHLFGLMDGPPFSPESQRRLAQ